jgi:hypothetical protein
MQQLPRVKSLQGWFGFLSGIAAQWFDLPLGSEGSRSKLNRRVAKAVPLSNILASINI